MGAGPGAQALFVVWAAPRLKALVDAGSEGDELGEVEGVWGLEVGEGG